MRTTHTLLPIAGILLAAALWMHLTVVSAEESSGAVQLTHAERLVVDCDAPPPPVTVDSATLRGEWSPVALPHALPAQLLTQARSATAGACAEQTVWYRFRLAGLSPPPGPLVLYAARAKGDGPIAVYGDGLRLYQAQTRGVAWNSTRVPLWVRLDDHGAAPHEVLIRLGHSARTREALTTVWIGPEAALHWRYQTRLWLQTALPAMSGAAFLAVGIFSLLVWNRRRHEQRYLLFFVLSVTAYLRGLHFYADIPIANDAFAWLTVNALFWMVATVHLFILELHGQRQVWVTRFVIALPVVIALLTLPVVDALPNTPKVTPLIYLLAMVMGATVAGAGLAASWRRSSQGLLLAGGVGLCTLFGIDDWLLQNHFINPEGWYLGAYTNLLTFSIFSYIMYRRYLDAIADVERSNANLAQRLQQQAAELAESHRRLREIEQRETLSRERQRLMQDMHDGLGSSLRTALWAVEQGNLDEAAIAGVLRDCIDDLKLTIDSMEPVESDVLLLLATLRYRLGSRLESSGITLRWEVEELPALDWLDPRNALHILRILQEAFANIIKHTRATEIRVATRAEGDHVVVTVTDNGQGFALEEAMGKGGKGLSNQLRRAEAIGGEVRWESGSAGTSFSLYLPLSRMRQIA